MSSVIEASKARKLSEVAGELGLNPCTLWRWVKIGVVGPDGSRVKLRAVKFPGSWRVVEADLETFLAILNQRQTELPEPTGTPARAENDRASKALEASGW